MQSPEESVNIGHFLESHKEMINRKQEATIKDLEGMLPLIVKTLQTLQLQHSQLVSQNENIKEYVDELT